jgi:ferredoxin--NADP+ reductase
LPNHEFLGDIVRDKLLYFPAVSREAFEFNGQDHHGRITDMLADGRMTRFLGLDDLDAKYDRAMICGSPAMLQDFRELLDARGFSAAPRIGTPGEYVFERAFVEK